MNYEQVTLVITSEGSHNYISDIRIFDELTGDVRPVEQIRNFASATSEIRLGVLNELQTSHLIVDTLAQKSSDDKVFKIGYIIKYNETEVERNDNEMNFGGRATAILSFRFRFCPRHPFC